MEIDQKRQVDNEDDKDLFIINFIKDYPYIYDKKTDDYKNNVKERKVWEKLVTLYEEKFKDSDANVGTIQSRWEKLKRSFKSEHKKVIKYIPSGSAAQKHQITFGFYDDLKFLIPSIGHNWTSGSIEFPSNNAFATATSFDFQMAKEYSDDDEEDHHNKETGSVGDMPVDNENFETSIDILKCGQNIEGMLQKVLEVQKENSLNQISGFEKIIVTTFRNLPENVKLSKFNEIMNILEK